MFGRQKRLEAAAKAAAQEVVKSLDTRNPALAKIWPGFKNRDEYNNGYKQIPNIYAVINAVSRRVAQLPVKFYKPGGETEIQAPRAQELMARPSVGMDRAKLFEAIVINKEISGEWLLVKSEEQRRGLPQELKVFPASRYEPKYRAGAFVGWEVRPDKRDPFVVLWDEVVYDRYYNPWDDLRGLSPMSVARLSAETEYSARRYNKTFFDNDASPGKTYTTDEWLDDASYQRLKQQLIDDRMGVEEAHKGLILEGGLTPVTDAFSQKDIQFIEQFRLTLQDICSVYGVDPAIIGHEEMSKYASVKEARRYFWTDKIIPFAQGIARTFNAMLFSDLGFEMHFDFTGVDALNDVVLEKADAATKFAALGYTRNEINEVLGLGFPNEPQHDEPAPAGRAPQAMGAGAQRAIDPARIEGKDTSLAVEALRGMKWKDVDAKVRPAIGKMNARLRNYFYEVRQKLLKQLTNKEHTALLVKGPDDINVEGAFNEEKLQRIFNEFITTGAMLGYKDIVGATGSEVPEAVMMLVAKRGKRVKEVVENARKEVLAGVQEAVREALSEQLTETETAALLVDKLSGKIDNVKNRSRTIARTEVHGAFSEGRHDGMEESAPAYHRWISSRDSEVRDSHDWLDGEKVPWGQAFSNGLMYPGDPNGAADEVINCRCVEEPIYEGEE